MSLLFFSLRGVVSTFTDHKYALLVTVGNAGSTGHNKSCLQMTVYTNGFAGTAMAGSAWTLLLITIARCYAVLRPLRMTNCKTNCTLEWGCLALDSWDLFMVVNIEIENSSPVQQIPSSICAAIFERRPLTLIATIVCAAVAFNIPRHFELIDEVCYDARELRHTRHIMPTSIRVHVSILQIGGQTLGLHWGERELGFYLIQLTAI
jgi:hypothetical protein